MCLLEACILLETFEDAKMGHPIQAAWRPHDFPLLGYQALQISLVAFSKACQAALKQAIGITFSIKSNSPF